MVAPDDRWQFSARGPYPRRAGNRVVPWVDGLPFYERLATAFRQATTRIWAIVSFIEPGFTFPDGTPWWELLANAQARGIDVRVLFWRNPRFFKTKHVFLGGPRERDKLRQWGAKWAARWDSSGGDAGHCHHQKAYVVDGLTDHPIGFVGGMVLSHATLAAPGHRHGMAKHDAFFELHGPVVADTEHNFVQRWNFACQDAEAPPWPTASRAGPLAFPTRIPDRRGEAEVQLSRTIKPGAYPKTPPPPGGRSYDTCAGEAGILDHYRGAFAAATKTIYIENQHPGQLVLLRLLAAALARGVRVVMVVPGIPMRAIYQAAAEVSALALADRVDEHRYGPTFRALAALAKFPNFTLVALARSDPDGRGGLQHREIYTHAKLAIVDGTWVTLGSANLVDLSLDYDHSELNASVWSEATALGLLRHLVGEHSDRNCDACTDIQALDRLANLARKSRQSLLAGGRVVGGCYALDPTRYALGPPLTAGESGETAV